jgi:HSP20 family molecular chaperone IbpA
MENGRKEGGIMTKNLTKSIQANEKKAAKSPAEKKRVGITFTPAVDIFETEEEMTVLADMPGVKAKDLTIDLRGDILTLTGQVAPPEGENETDVLREYRSGSYFRQFSLSEVIDRAKIGAELKEGVLRLVLPKVRPAKPRRITVKVE